MRSAALDSIIGVEVRTRTKDTQSGELVDSWSPLFPRGLHAQLVQGQALERYALSQEVAEVSVGFRLRWSPALLTLTPDEHRITYNGFTYNIRGVTEIQRRKGVVALCIARAEGRTAQGLPPGGV